MYHAAQIFQAPSPRLPKHRHEAQPQRGDAQGREARTQELQGDAAELGAPAPTWGQAMDTAPSHWGFPIWL